MASLDANETKRNDASLDGSAAAPATAPDLRDGSSSSSSSAASSYSAAVARAVAAKPLRLRMRGDTGMKSVDGLTSGSTGEELRALCDTLLGGAGIQTLSFRMDDGANCVLITQGGWRGSGALLVGPARTLEEMGITTGTVVNASANPPPKRHKAENEDGDNESDEDDDESDEDENESDDDDENESDDEFLSLYESLERDETILASALRSPFFDPNMKHPLYGGTLLHDASVSVTKLLLAHPRLDPNIGDRTPLYGAVEDCKPDVVEALLADPRVDPNIVNPNDERTALMNVAVSWDGCGDAGDIYLVLKLLLADSRTTRLERQSYDALVWYDAALAWANRQGTDAEAAPEEFIPAAYLGDDATVASALRNPLLVDPNMANEGPGDLTATALIEATVRKHDSVVKVLLADKRVDPNISDDDGHTALSLAASDRAMSTLKLLLADDRTIRTRPEEGGEYYGAALAWVNRQGTDAEAAPEEFIPAAYLGDDATVASALRNPLVDPNMTDENGVTAILAAVQLKNAPVVKMLLADERLDPNIVSQNARTTPYSDDEKSSTALMAAVDLNDASMVKMLLADERVDPNISDEDGHTALTNHVTLVRGGTGDIDDEISRLLRADPRTIIDPEWEQKIIQEQATRQREQEELSRLIDREERREKEKKEK